MNNRGPAAKSYPKADAQRARREALWEARQKAKVCPATQGAKTCSKAPEHAGRHQWAVS